MAYQTGDNNFAISKYIVDPSANGTQFTTIQAALDQADADGGDAVVHVRPFPGGYIENLTLYASVALEGDSQDTVLIEGTHTPPSTGLCAISNCTLQSATDIFSSADAGTADIVLSNCVFDCVSGYAFNLSNWAGTISINNCSDISVDNAGVNNAGGASVTINYSYFGNSTSPMTINHASAITGSTIGCAISLIQNAELTIEAGSVINQYIMMADTSLLNVSNSTLNTGTDTAITTSSTGMVTLANVVINSSNAAVIDGTGPVTFGEVTYLNGSTVGATVVKTYDTVVETGLLALPTTTATAGQITTNGTTLIHSYGTDNIFAGNGAGNFTMVFGSGQQVGIGNNALHDVTSGGANTAVGSGACGDVTTGNYNCALGQALWAVTTGSSNLGIGNQAGWQIQTGSFNTCLGANAGNALTLADSYNIMISNTGAAGLSNKIRIGNETDHNACTLAGNVDTTSATAGGTRSLTVANTDNTNAASTALIKASTGGASAGDAQFQASTTTTTWTFGVDNSVTAPTADPFVIAQGTALGTNNVMSVATTGEINYPLQPSFRAYASLQSDVTGDGTSYDVLFANEDYDQNSDFAASVFTAPVTGKYVFNVGITLEQAAGTFTEVILSIVTTAGTYRLNAFNPGGMTLLDLTLSFNASIIIPMTATDTAKINLVVSGGTKTIDIAAGTDKTWFAGQLIA